MKEALPLFEPAPANCSGRYDMWKISSDRNLWVLKQHIKFTDVSVVTFLLATLCKDIQTVPQVASSFQELSSKLP